jgi:hypothetical protein
MLDTPHWRRSIVSIVGTLPRNPNLFDCQAAPQPEARRRPISLSAGPWNRPEGRARRPLASQASTSKSETTLGIGGLHFEIGAFPGAAPDQFELPPRASNARHRQGGLPSAPFQPSFQTGFLFPVYSARVSSVSNFYAAMGTLSTRSRA